MGRPVVVCFVGQCGHWQHWSCTFLGGVLAFLGSAMSCGSKNLQFELLQAIAKCVQRFPKCQQPLSASTVLQYLCYMMDMDCVHVRETKFSNICHHTCSKQSATLRINTSCAFELFYLYNRWLRSFIAFFLHKGQTFAEISTAHFMESWSFEALKVNCRKMQKN